MDNKIDFVMIWVDGNDPEWQKEKNKYDSSDEKGDNTIVRYRSWDNLQYWFRGIEKFAPWVNKVHFVTWGHLPPWLNKEIAERECKGTKNSAHTQVPNHFLQRKAQAFSTAMISSLSIPILIRNNA